MGRPTRSFLHETIMMTQNPSWTFVIVEGDKDRRCLARHLDKNKVIIRAVSHEEGGKTKVIECIKELNARNRSNALAIVDADFDNLTDRINVDNLFQSQFHDIDIDILMTGVLEDVLAIIVRPGLVDELIREGSETHDDCLGRALEVAGDFGLVKLACFLASQNLIAKGIPGVSAMNIRSYCKGKKGELRTDTARYLRDHIVECSSADLGEIHEEEKARRHDNRQLASGHDVFFLLILLLKPKIRKEYRNKESILADDVKKALCPLRFRKLLLHAFIRGWEQQHGKQIMSWATNE